MKKKKMKNGNIPTAKEIIDSWIDFTEWGTAIVDAGKVEELLKEFAQLHVEAALKAAAENAIAKENPDDYGTGEIWVDKESILNSYKVE